MTTKSNKILQVTSDYSNNECMLHSDSLYIVPLPYTYNTVYGKWAATCDFQQCGIWTSVDESVQPTLKLRNSKLCSVSSFTIIEYSSN